MNNPSIAFGPVPSRRLGHSLGINNIPHKICTYSCVYCQVGHTLEYRIEPAPFYEPENIVRVVAEKLASARDMNSPVDYLTFVPDGEPTLDQNIGRTIELLKTIGVKIGVITNGTLIDRKDVRAALSLADWVSLKTDAVNETGWKRINRPYRGLKLDSILNGMLEFSREYLGILVTETMLVRGLNDDTDNLDSVAEFLGRLKPAIAYLAIPTRPPANSWVLQPEEETVARAHQILTREVPRVEHLIGYEGNAFAFTGNTEEDLLSITAVHPMREEAMHEFLHKAKADWDVVQGMLGKGKLIETEYDQRKFYIRAFPKKKASV